MISVQEWMLSHNSTEDDITYHILEDGHLDSGSFDDKFCPFDLETMGKVDEDETYYFYPLNYNNYRLTIDKCNPEL